MWAGVRARFSQFHGNLLLTQDQIDDGVTKHHGVRQCLNRHYYDSPSEKANSFLIGSWCKDTRVRPPRDIDLYFLLSPDVYYRFQSYAENRQSALLQEVKEVLQSTYSSTAMRGDGQVVVVRFNTINVEVVPAFPLDNGRYCICDTHDGGRYKETDPKAEVDLVQTVHANNNNNLRPLIKMLKAWQSSCSVPISSFCLELSAIDFLPQCPWRLRSYLYYDWIARDFFAFLCGRVNTFVYAPGTYEPVFLGDAWKSHAESAHNRALEACEYEYHDRIHLAGEEWQRIFGDQIPMSV